MSEARAHPHNVARRTFVDVDGAPQPAPAPRFDRTPSEVRRARRSPPAPTPTPRSLDWGFAADEIASLKQAGTLA